MRFIRWHDIENHYREKFIYNFFYNNPDLVDQEFVVTEKLDGCLDENTIIETKDGSMTIKNICDIKYKGKILSYNTNTHKNEWNSILQWSIISTNDDWYEINLRDGSKLKLTGSHRVWLPDLNCYRRVDELQGDEILLKR